MIAKEGFPYVLITVAGLFALIIIPKAMIVVLGFLLLILFFWFFRDPERRIPSLENVAVSAADGKVVEVGVVDIDGKQYQKVSVFMNLFSVHVNRSPIKGIVKSITHIQGEFKNAAKPEASIENERNIMVLDTEHGDVIVTQVAGLIARRTVCNVSVGDSLDTGDRYGMIKFSSRIDHYFPMSFNIAVNEDDQVKAGESIIATF